MSRPDDLAALPLWSERHGDRLDVGHLPGLDDHGPTHVAEVVAAVQAVHAAEPGTTLRLIADHAPDHLHPLPLAVAAELGLGHHRDLLQLRRAIPLAADDPARPSSDGSLPLRPFDPGRDVGPWLRANNRAFVADPDQGGQTEDDLRGLLAEPWVELDGFLVADDLDRPGELAGSCWTRIHPATEADPALGEIFVIGVDPSQHGHGLGAHLVVAGLDHLASRGLAVGMLYVDAANAPARRLYARLGFTEHLRRRIHTAHPQTAGTDRP